MQLEHKIENSICLLTIEGNLALDGVSEAKNYIKPFLSDNSIKGIVINFEKVNFIDSSGIGLVVSVYKTLQQRQAKVALSNLSKKNIEIFTMTRLDKILSIHDSQESAISSVS